MKFSPWIDPRVADLKPAQARAYLEAGGWRALPLDRPSFQLFEGPQGEDRLSDVVGMPTSDHFDDYVQRMIELLGNLALIEDRYAVRILDEMLAFPADVAHHPNGVALVAVSPRG